MLTSDLITSVQRRAAIPESQITFTATDFYALMDEEIASKLVPLVLSTIEEYYVADYPYNITMGQNAYPLPSRAVASSLRDVQIISSTDPDSIIPLERLDIANLFAATSSSYRVLIKKSGFYIKSNTVYMYPSPTYTENIINLEYYSRPNQCVDPSTCAQITAINGSQITVTGVPSNITTATKVDFVKQLSGFECTAIDQVITSIAGSILTMTSTPPTTLSVGDYVCPATQTCIVQVPQELLPLLSQYVVVRVLAAQGDMQAYQAAEQELQMIEKNALLLLTPRVTGKPKRVVQTRGVARFV